MLHSKVIFHKLIITQTTCMTKQNFKRLYYFIGLTIILLLFNAQTIRAQIDWHTAGSDPDKYKMGVDSSIKRDNQNVMTIKSIDQEIQGFGTYMTSFKPGQYLGKRVRMTGYMKSKDVADWAGFWLRVDPADTLQDVLAFDNMYDRPVKGTTDWNKYTIVLDVPDNASNIAFGALLPGTGQIWFSNPVFDIVDKSVSTTGLQSKKDSEFVAITPKGCETEATMKSLNANASTSLRFRNNTSGNVTVYWIDYSGQRNTNADQIRQVSPGRSIDLSTFLTHPFIVIGANNKCYGIYEATAKPSIAIIKD
jgi:hypothetical protein